MLPDGFRTEWRVAPAPGGHYFLDYPKGLVQEINTTGKIVWQYSLAGSGMSPARRHDGNTLVACTGDRLAEIDRGGRMVWEVFPRDQGSISQVRECLSLVRLGFDTPASNPIDIATSVPYRVKGLKDKDAFSRYRSVRELERLGRKALPAVPELIEVLAADDETLRRAAHDALTSVGPDILPFLIKACKDKRPVIRAESLRQLGQFRGQAKETVPLLVEALSDESVLVRRQAPWALQMLGPDCRLGGASARQGFAREGRSRHCAPDSCPTRGCYRVAEHG
jgi:hypothetical protein